MAAIECNPPNVEQVLANILNPDNNIRQQAEAILKQFLTKAYRGQLWPSILTLLRTSANPQARNRA